MKTYAFTTTGGSTVDPAAAVVNGVATVDINLTVTEDGHSQSFMWARAGQAVSTGRLAEARQVALGATALLTGTLTTTLDTVQASAHATRYLPAGATTGTVRGAQNLGTDTVTIAPQGTDTIDGGTAPYQLDPGKVIRFQSDGSGAWVEYASSGSGAAAVPDGSITLPKLSTGVQTSIGKADGSAQKASNLSDVANAGTARTNLGLGTAATQASTAFDAAGAATAAQTASLQKASNLSDVASAGTARTNLGLGTAATLASSAVAQTANNLSDVASASTSRTNLGLGSAATMTPTSIAADAALTGTYAPLASPALTGSPTINGTPAASMSGTRPVGQGEIWTSLKEFGAKGDTVYLATGGSISSGSNAFTSTGAAFATGDVGKSIFILGAGASGAILATTIVARISTTQVTLSSNAGTTVSNAKHYYGTDDTAAVQAASNSGKAIIGPAGFYLTDAFTLPTRCHFRGMGAGVTEFVAKPGQTGPLMSLAAPASELTNVSHFSIDGKRAFQVNAASGGVYIATDPNGSNMVAASYYGSNDPALYFGYIMVHDAKGDGWSVTGRGACRTEHLRIFNCDGHGIKIDNYDSWWDNIEVGAAGLDGIYMTGNAANNRVNNVKVFYSGMVDRTTYGAGLRLLGRYNQFGPMEIQNAGTYGAYLDGAGNNIFAALYIEFPSANVGPMVQTTLPGLYLNDSNTNVFMTTILDRNTPSHLQYGIQLNKTTTGSSNNTFIANISNTLSGTTQVSGGQNRKTNVFLINGDSWITASLAFQFLTPYLDDAAANTGGVILAGAYQTPSGMMRLRAGATAVRDTFTVGINLGSATGPQIVSGTGSPEGAVTAPVGSQYLRSDGGANTSLYVKESGAGNTGWVAK